MKTKFTLLISIFCSLTYVNGQDITITDNVGTGDVYWTSNNIYHLDGGVFVNSGTTLHIEAGTVVKGMPGQGESSSYLCVAQGGKIMAEGTSDTPIIFTFEADPLDGSTSLETRGQWGGLIVLGNAGLNSEPGVSAIEGIPTTETRGQYGGSDDMDDSGVLRYVSIRHAGVEIGAGNEINGLTLGGVGSGTVIDNVEVIANMDDGIEFFGGTVSVTNAMVYGCGDDSYDYDEGWRGQLNSNWVSVASSDDGDRGGEHDGGTSPETAMPYATPSVNYATFVGKGDARALTFRDNAGGSYSNSVFYNYGSGVDVEDLTDGEDSYARLLAGDLNFTNNIVDCGGSLPMVTSAGGDLSEYFDANGNSTSSDHGVTWDAGYASLAGRADWASWTLAVTSGRVSLGTIVNGQDITITDNVGTGDVYWTSNNIYHLDGGVFVNSGTTLHIEAGTVVKGMPGQGESSSYLCVAQGGKIMAEGTSDTPIIFTFEADPLDGSTSLETRGQWGGLIVLGNAGLNSEPGVSAIEGIPTTETRGQYGGSDDMDDSGVLRYVSIRHAGVEIGAGNEINGLTLGGVGSGTVIDNVEVIANMDDGIEFFGGTVSVTNAMVYGCGDDSYDYDEGWRGQLNSNWVSVASSDDGDRGGEHDGGTSPETAMPYATPSVNYATFVGKGDARALTFRDNAGGSYSNSVFYNYGSGVDVEDLTDGEDSYARLLAGDLNFTNNIVDCGGSLPMVTSAGGDLSEYFDANGNSTSSDHGVTWDAGYASLAGRADWASWTLAVTSGRVSLGTIVNVEEIFKSDVVVYPNPIVDESVHIMFEESQEVTYSLISLLGQIVQQGSFCDSRFTLSDITKSGTYFLEINYGDHKITKTILKN